MKSDERGARGFGDPLPPDEAMVERLLARQRHEVMERISRLERAKSLRRGALSLAAGVLAFALLIGLRSPAAISVEAELAALPPVTTEQTDPLEAFAAWDEQELDQAPAALADFALPELDPLGDDASPWLEPWPAITDEALAGEGMDT